MDFNGFFHILGMSSSQPTNSMIFQWCRSTTNQIFSSSNSLSLAPFLKISGGICQVQNLVVSTPFREARRFWTLGCPGPTCAMKKAHTVCEKIWKFIGLGIGNHPNIAYVRVVNYYNIYIYPRCSMYGIFTYIWLIFGVNVGKYSIHGAYGYIYVLYI